MASIFSWLPLPYVVFSLVLAFVLGSVMASFVTCVAGRLVAHESPWSGRSRCDACGHVLEAIDLVPIVSWARTGGRCRHCGEAIPARCVLTEVALGFVFVLIVGRYGLGIESVTYCALATILLGLSLVDLDTMVIPNGFILAGIVVWLLQLAACLALELAGGASTTTLGTTSPSGPLACFGMAPAAFAVSLFAPLVGPGALALALDGLVGGFVVGGGMLLLSLGFDLILGRRSMGGGDIKLYFMVGLFLGLPLGIFNVVLSCIVGLVFVTVGGSLDKPFPFGPSIALSTVLSLLVGGIALTWYVGLLC